MPFKYTFVSLLFNLSDKKLCSIKDQLRARCDALNLTSFELKLCPIARLQDLKKLENGRQSLRAYDFMKKSNI